MIINEKLEQGSEEWFNIRKGRITASELSNILTPTGKISKSSIGYARKLARECVCNDPLEFQGNKYTDWGNEMEPRARELFEKETGFNFKEVGFCNRADNAPVGCSPDALVEFGGDYFAGLEIKCPQVDTHVETLMNGVLPAKYKLQVHGSMAITGLDNWYFMSYFPDLNPFILFVERDEFTEKVGQAIDDFIVDYAKIREEVLAKIIPNKKVLV